MNAGKKCSMPTMMVWMNSFVLNVKSGYHIMYFDGDCIACFLVRYPNSRHLQENYLSFFPLFFFLFLS